MLADIDLVAAFLPSKAAFARARRHTEDVVYSNVPAAMKAAEHKMMKNLEEQIVPSPKPYFNFSIDIYLAYDHQQGGSRTIPQLRNMPSLKTPTNL